MSLTTVCYYHYYFYSGLFRQMCFYMIAMIPLVFGFQLYGGDDEKESAW